ncbi:MAG: type II secretion system protein [Peptoniphilus senegalensis]|uniref:type II secretion system protein n=1 Tax=Peptoniphilus senegalensis TaxID=1465757 RepID=UPI0039995514
MKLKSKNRGHLMLEVLFSIAIIGLIASVIMPNIITLLENQNHIKEREELIYSINSKMEEIIGETYNKKDFNFDGIEDENENFEINVTKNSDGNLEHVIVSGKRRDSDEEIKLEVYLPKEGLFPN